MKNLKADLVSGFVIFLIALPLSIGISLAAGVPASAGILSAILGGILGTFFTGSHVIINGPAAGLIVVVLGSVQSLSDGDPVVGFKRTLGAVVIAGILQVICGALKWGRLAFLAPASVVHGMLSAIGVIILIKQVPVILGAFPKVKTIPGMITEMPNYFANADIPIAITGVVCLLIIILWNKFAGDLKKIVPGPLLVVVVGLILSYFFDISNGHEVSLFNHLYHVGPEFLVHVPDNIAKMIIFPSFDIITSGRSISAILTLFIVLSLESLLSSYAVDKLDPQKRKSDLDKDLFGKGIVNIACGLLGAYPIISEIVRSSANISNGAKTMWSNFFHGVFILLFVALFPSFINHIPLAALAAVLLIVGFNLAHPRHFKEVYHHGADQLLFFCTTLIITIVEDLLVGIAAGIVLKLIFHLARGVKFKYFFNPNIEIVKENKNVVIQFKSPVVFLGYLKLKKIFTENEGSNIKIQKNDYFVDFTIRELIKDSIHDAVDLH
jgi:MFS superfamily sulfate permease-like transporter